MLIFWINEAAVCIPVMFKLTVTSSPAITVTSSGLDVNSGATPLQQQHIHFCNTSESGLPQFWGAKHLQFLNLDLDIVCDLPLSIGTDNGVFARVSSSGILD